MAKENSPNTKELIKEDTLKHQKGRKNMVTPLEFSKLYLTVETKITTLMHIKEIF